MLEVDIVDTKGPVWSGPATRVVAPVGGGEIGVLTGHTPVLSVIRPGDVRVLEPQSSVPLRWHVTHGFFSVDSDQVTIVVDEATEV